MTIYTMRCTLLVLLSALLSTSVFARHHSRRTAFVPKRTSVVSSLASEPAPLSTLGTSAFAVEREAQIVAAAQVSSLVLAATLCRGGSYYQGDDDDDRYYNDRGYGGGNDDYYSNESSYNYDDNYYDDRGRSDDREKGSRFGALSSSMPDIIRTGNRKIGLPLLGIGGVLTVLGMSLFFNKTLMRLGNLFFVAGIPMTLGPGRTAGYFFQPKKARATGCLAAGIMLVFIGWPIFGIILEVFGLLNLFGNMFPMAMMIMKQMPVIGPLLKGDAGKKKNSRDDDRYDDRYQDDRYDDYYNDRGYQDDDDRRNSNW